MPGISGGSCVSLEGYPGGCWVRRDDQQRHASDRRGRRSTSTRRLIRRSDDYAGRQPQNSMAWLSGSET